VHSSLPALDVAAVAATSNLVLLDVRENDEWASGHAAHAIHIPMGEIVERVHEIDRSKRVVCICRSGGRSARVTQWLRQQGIDAVNLAGGMHAWVGAQHPVINHTGHPGVVI
jgi:rhodanese-related sulfurtransferase